MLLETLYFGAYTLESITPLDFMKWYFSDPFRLIITVLLILAICYVIHRFILQPTSLLMAGIINFFRLQRTDMTILAITPPAHSDKSPEATNQLITVLQQVLIDNSRWAKLWGRSGVASLEITASYNDGIRYIVRLPEKDIAIVQRHLASHISNLRFSVLEDVHEAIYPNQAYNISELHQYRHYAYPLHEQTDYTEQDPISYITGAMTKLEPNESVTMQSIITPYFSRRTVRLRNKLIHRGDAVLDNKVKYFITSRWRVWLVALALGSLTQNLIVALVAAAVLLCIALLAKGGAPTLSPAEQRTVDLILNKLAQPLFRTNLRVFVSANSFERCNELTEGIYSSLAPLNVPGYQSLYTRKAFFKNLLYKYRLFKFGRRLPSLFAFLSNKFSTSELTSLYHFPYGDITTEDLSRSHSRTLPAPLSLKNNDFDIVLARNNHHGSTTEIGLTTAERERHVFVVGGTGNGKTTLLEYGLVQDIRNGKGVAVVDPHGDMAFKLLKYVPESRIDDVVYFNPDDLSYPIGLNMLELPTDLTGDDLLRAKDLITESVISVFRKIFSDDDSGGHRIEYVLRNAVHTALTVEGCTLFTIYDLLNDPDYRKRVVSKLKDKNLVNFWKNEMGKAGGMQQVKMMAGITSKIGRFLFSASAKRILEQPKSTIDFDEILNGKILICNFSKGLIGDDTSELFGIAILAKLQLAALRRARIPQIDRQPFYLYVDEFQNFATDSFVQMLSEARKYKLFLTMAEQSTSQQDDPKIVDTIFANAGTLICFRSGSPTDEKYFLPRLKPVNEGEIGTLPSYNFYIRIAAVESQEAFSGETLLLEDEGDENVRTRVIAASQKNYAKEYIEQEEGDNELSNRKQSTAQNPQAAVKQKTSKPLIPKKNKLS